MREPPGPGKLARDTASTRRKKKARNRARTRWFQREAERAREWLEHEARHGVTWVLIRGDLRGVTRDGGVVDMCCSDELYARLTHYLKHKGRSYATLEEARFVLMPVDVPRDGLAGAVPPGIRSGSE
jgi:hypothetical protein